MSQSTKELVGARIDRATVEAVSARKTEPAWLREWRLAAFDHYLAAPMPTLREEEWRRTDLRALRLDDAVPYAEPTTPVNSLSELDPALLGDLAESDVTGGTIVQHNNGTVYSSLSDNLAQRGILFSGLDAAVREHGDLVQKYLGTAVPASYSKFSALNAAFWSGGVFLYVPRRVEVSLPLRALTWLDRPGLSSFSRTLVIAEPDSEVVLVDEWAGPTSEGQAVAANVQEVLVAQGARVRYVTLQEWGRHVWNFSINRAIVGRDATVKSVVVAFGGRLHKANVESSLEGPGSSAEMLGLLFGDKNQVLDHHTLQDHRAPHTSSDLLYKGALSDKARSIYSGLIHARKVAQKTDAIQTNRNLLLSKDSRADSIPNLEIEANDLRCTHAATISPIDEEQLFYLRARGLTESDAKRAIVEGFFETVLERIPLEGIVERLRATISSKIGD